MRKRKPRGSLADISNIEALRGAWAEISLGKKGAARKMPGSDGISLNSFAENLDDNLSLLSGYLRKKTFEYSPLLPHFEEKADGKLRVICVPTVRDRVVQRVLLEFLQADGNERYWFRSDVSYGFIKHRKVIDAIKRAKDLRAAKKWAYKTDIKSFFDAIPRDELKAKIESKIRLPGILPLLLAACDCEAKPRNDADAHRLKSEKIRQGVGLRQGMPLSPYFSNVFLAGFDQKMVASAIDMVRYADDLVFFAESEQACKEIDGLCRAELQALGLEIHPLGTVGKCEIRAPDQAVEFLGVELAPKGSAYTFRLSDKQMEKKRQALFEMSNVDDLLAKRLTITKFAQRMQSKIDGWMDAYEHVDNIGEFEQKVGNWRVTVIERVFVEGLGLPKEKMNLKARQFLELAALPKPVAKRRR